MRTPSKLMPKYVPPKGVNKCAVIFFCAIMLLIIGTLLWQVPWILLLIPGLLLASRISMMKYEKKIMQMVQERKGHDIGDFARSFNCRKTDTWVIRAVYEQIQDYVSTEKITLPIYAEDHLFEDLEIDEEDLYEDLLEEIAQRTGRSFDNVKNNPYFNKANTVGDLVNFFNNQPLKSFNKSTA